MEAQSWSDESDAPPCFTRGSKICPTVDDLTLQPPTFSRACIGNVSPARPFLRAEMALPWLPYCLASLPRFTVLGWNWHFVPDDHQNRGLWNWYLIPNLDLNPSVASKGYFNAQKCVRKRGHDALLRGKGHIALTHKSLSFLYSLASFCLEHVPIDVSKMQKQKYWPKACRDQAVSWIRKNTAMSMFVNPVVVLAMSWYTTHHLLWNWTWLRLFN